MKFIPYLLQTMRENRTRDFWTALENEVLPCSRIDLYYALLMRSISMERYKIARLLLSSGCPANQRKSSRRNSPLHIAASRKDSLSMVKTLLDHGASVTEQNIKGETPLHVAFYQQASNGVLDLMLEYGYRLGIGDAVDNKGVSLLHIACARSKIHVIKHFLKACGAGVNRQVSLNSAIDVAGNTPLHFAVENGLLEGVKLLLCYGASIYLKNAVGSTPMHIACERRDIEMVDLMFQFDELKEDSVNRFGLSHFMAACMTRNSDNIEHFIYNIENSHVFLQTAITLIYNLVNSRVSFSATYMFSGYTPLHFAAEFGNTEVAQVLLDVGAKSYIFEGKEYTPADLAAMSGYFKIVEKIRIFNSSPRVCYQVEVIDNWYERLEGTLPSDGFVFAG